MDKVELQGLLKMIKGTYGNKFEINEFTVDSWHELLSNQSLEETNELFKMHASKDDFPPSISKLILKKPFKEREVEPYFRPSS